jgi:retron-type reverse transcriptase
LEIAWNKVKKNKGCGGVDGQSIDEFETDAIQHLDRLHDELRNGKYGPKPVLQHLIPKSGQAGKMRVLGIPTVYDRVCQQAILNRLEGIFEPIFDDAGFGYRHGRSTKDALRKVWKEIEEGHEWIVDADPEDFF